MNNKLREIIENIQLYQDIQSKIKKINEEMEKTNNESEYYKIVNDLMRKLSNYRIFIMSSELTYDELLAIVEKKVKDKLDEPLTLDYDENELIESYNNELSEEEKKQYGSYENFKKTLLEDYQKQQIEEKKALVGIMEEVKKTKVYYDAMNEKLMDLNNKKIELLNERWSLLETKLKNYHAKLLENGIEYENGFPVLKDDMEMVNNVPKLDADNISLDDLIMVHATKYFPQDGVIKSSRDAIGSRRNTIHTSLNGRVSSHNYGNWEDCGIIVLDSLKEHIDQVECIYSVDTFTYGSVKLSNDALILIDGNKFNELYEQNKDYIDKNKDKIILYSGSSIKIVENVLSMLGYAPQKIGQWGWEDKHNNDMLNKFVQDNYPNKLNAPHDVTVYSSVEKESLRFSTLNKFGIIDGNDTIITPEILYDLRLSSKDLSTKQFIIDVGIIVKDNEIHLLGTKDHLELMKTNKVSDFQIEKVELLLKKYELMQQYQNDEHKNK